MHANGFILDEQATIKTDGIDGAWSGWSDPLIFIMFYHDFSDQGSTSERQNIRRLYLKGSDYSISRQIDLYPATEQQLATKIRYLYEFFISSNTLNVCKSKQKKSQADIHSTVRYHLS